jgi:hypothetical protein
VHGVESAPITLEEEYFPPPPELREILRALETAVSLMAAAPTRTAGGVTDEVGATVLSGDRSTGAADVLEGFVGVPGV